MTENDKVIITKSKINSIVNAIHSKNNESDGYTLDQMAAKIRAIPSGSSESIEGSSSGGSQGYIQLSSIKIKVDTFNRTQDITITNVTPVQ